MTEKRPGVDEPIPGAVRIHQQAVPTMSADRIEVHQAAAQSMAADHIDIRQGAAAQAQARQITVEQGAVALARADSIRVEMGAVGAAIGDKVEIHRGFARIAAARGRLDLRQAGAITVVAERVSMAAGSGAIFVFARRVDGEVRTLFDWRSGAAFGAAAGLVIGLLARGRRRR
jgi:hypothetical protein